jgi:hypothetical protein
VALAERLNDMLAGLPRGWERARIDVTVEEADEADRAAIVLAPATPGRSGSTFHLHVASGTQRLAATPEMVRRVLHRLDTEGVRARIRLVEHEGGAGGGAPRGRPAPGPARAGAGGRAPARPRPPTPLTGRLRMCVGIYSSGSLRERRSRSPTQTTTRSIASTGCDQAPPSPPVNGFWPWRLRAAACPKEPTGLPLKVAP